MYICIHLYTCMSFMYAYMYSLSLVWSQELPSDSVPGAKLSRFAGISLLV